MKIKLISLIIILVILIALVFGFFHFTTNKEAKQSGWGWGNYSSLGNGPVTFTYFPISLDKVTDITPLGHLGAPGHPIPTDHIYPHISGSAEVRAPASGIITEIHHFPGEGTYSITITHTNTFKSWLEFSNISDWILKKADGREINLNIPIKTGEIVGSVSGDESVSGIDWGVYDKNVTLNFINPKKYGPYTPHTVCPLKYLSSELKTLAYNKTYVNDYSTPGKKLIARPRCGKIDYDQPGKLVGNWLLEGVPNINKDTASEKMISFVYAQGNHSQILVGIGGTLSISKITTYSVEGNSPDPANVSVETGIVIYRLRGDPASGMESLTATLLVQMINNNKIKVEGFDGYPSNPKFTSNAKYYTR